MAEIQTITKTNQNTSENISKKNNSRRGNKAPQQKDVKNVASVSSTNKRNFNDTKRSNTNTRQNTFEKKSKVQSNNEAKPGEASIEQLKNRIDNLLNTNEKFYAVADLLSMIERGYLPQIKAMNYMLEKHGKNTRVTEDISLQRHNKDFIEPSTNINHALVVLSSAVFSGVVPLEELIKVQELSKENQNSLKEFEKKLRAIFIEYTSISVDELPYRMKMDILDERGKIARKDRWEALKLKREKRRLKEKEDRKAKRLEKSKSAAIDQQSSIENNSDKKVVAQEPNEALVDTELLPKETKTKDEWIEFAKEKGIDVPESVKLKDDIYELIKNKTEINKAS